MSIVCMLNSGKPLSEKVLDVLFFNACDMYQEDVNEQFIKARDYDGVIKSDLCPLEFNGVMVVRFEAIVSTEQWEGNQVIFVVQVGQLDGMSPGEWNQLIVKVFGPFDDIPPHIREMMDRLSEDDEDDQHPWGT